MNSRESSAVNQTDRARSLRQAVISRTLPAWIVLAGWLAVAAGGESPIQFRDRTADTRIAFRHTDGSSGQRYIVEYVSAGLALFDFDGDGDEDIYFLNGSPQPPESGKGPAPRDALYRNDGDFGFTDVTEQAGVGDTHHGLGVAAGDFDEDGDLDLYLNNFGPNVLYRNNGDGTFTDIALEAGVGNGHKVGAGCCFLDSENDGDLDLYVASYVKFSYASHVPHTFMGLPAYPSPLRYEPEPDTLYRNNGDGSFTDISVEAGIAQHAGTGMGTVCGDYDNDGDTDVFVGNDVMENFLFQNDGRGRFEEVGLLTGVAYDVHGVPHGSMGTDFGDYDNDGWFDLFVTSYGNEMATLFHNLGTGLFVDVSRQSGVGAPTLPHVTWGHGFIDFDNDGDRDLYVACGDLDDNVERRNDATAYELPNILLMNTGDGRFTDVSRASGDGMAVRRSSRGAAFDDLDADGRVDVVVLNSRCEPTVLRNESPAANHWLEVSLLGTRSNRQGVGSRVTISAGDLIQVDEVRSGRSYQSHFGQRLHFGLGRRDKVDRLEVRWPGGATLQIANPELDRALILREDSPQGSGG
jgi:hypothetical protein